MGVSMNNQSNEIILFKLDKEELDKQQQKKKILFILLILTGFLCGSSFLYPQSVIELIGKTLPCAIVIRLLCGQCEKNFVNAHKKAKELGFGCIQKSNYYLKNGKTFKMDNDHSKFMLVQVENVQ